MTAVPVPVFLSVVWDLMAGLSGFSSHESGLHLAAGSQYESSWVFQATNLVSKGAVKCHKST